MTCRKHSDITQNTTLPGWTNARENAGLINLKIDNLVAVSAQGYERKEDCLAAIALVKSTANDPIWDMSEIDQTQIPPFPSI